MSVQRASITLALSVGLVAAAALPAHAGSARVQKKSFSAPHGRSGKAIRYADRSGRVVNYVKVYAKDSDGRGGKCTETWVDYSTKPHKHFNPGVLVNCSGKNRSVSHFMWNDSRNIKGMQVVVCEVPDTNGRITRNSKNCRGNLKGIYLWSGKKYKHFKVKAAQFPSGVQVRRI